MRTLMICLLWTAACSSFLVSVAAAQTPAVEKEQAIESEQSVDAVEELPAQLTSVEAVRKLVAADPDHQYALLPRVSPRGVDAKTRAEMVELLMPLLQSEYPDIRARAAGAISLLGEANRVAIPALLRLLGDAERDVLNRTVSASASDGLVRIGTAVIGPARDRLPAAEGLEFLGLTAVISELGEHAEARASVSFFLEHLRSGPPQHRWACMYCLSKLGDTAKPAIPDYIRHLDDGNFNIQVIACLGLAALGADSRAAVPKLVQLTKKPGNMLSTRTHAAMCLGAIGAAGGVAEDVDLVALFTEMIAEPNAFCQERGLIALGRLGKRAEAAAPFVRGLFENEDFSQRPEAALALWQITGQAEDSLARLEPMITDLTYEHRTLESLRSMGVAAAPLADSVAARLETDDSSLQLMVAEVLVAMGKAAPHVGKLRLMADQAPPDIALELDAIIAGVEANR